MAKPVRIVLIILGILVLLLLTAMVVVQTQWAKGVIEDQVSNSLDGREVSIGELDVSFFPLGVRIENLSIANEPWAEHEQMLTLAEGEVDVNIGPLLRGNISLARLSLVDPVVHLARREDGASNWDALMDEEEDDEPADFHIGEINITGGELTYQDAALDADLTLAFATSGENEGEHHLRVTGQGQFQGNAVELDIQGGAPSEALDEDTPYAITLNGRVGDIQLGFDGGAADLQQFEGLHGQLDFSAPREADLGSLIGQPRLTIPALDFQAQVRQSGDRWALEDITTQAGDSQLTGLIALDQGEVPRFEVRLELDQLNLDRWGLIDMLEDAAPPEEAEADERPLVERLSDQLQILQEFAGTMDVGVGELIYAEQTLSNLRLQATLEDGRLDLQQLRMNQGDGELTAQGWIDSTTDPFTADIQAQAEQINLGQALAPFDLGELGVLTAQLNIQFDNEALEISDSDLHYDAPAQNLSVQATLASRDVPDSDTRGIRLEGSGERNGQSFNFDLIAGPLLDLTQPEEPYPLQGSFSTGETSARVDGAVAQPLELNAFDLQVHIQGPDPAELNALTELDLPAMPAYEADARIVWEDEILRINNLQGSFGSSDLSGDIRVRTNERAMVWATLHSDRLDVDDMLSLMEEIETDVNMEVDADGKVKADVDVKQQPEGERTKLFSAEPFELEVMASIDAEVVYQADHLISNQIPMDDVRIELTLAEGVLTVDPLRLGVGDGEIVAIGRLDGSGNLLQGNVELSMTQVGLRPLLRSIDENEAAESNAGVLGGRSELQFQGNSMEQLMASLNGTLEMAVSGGQLDLLIVEILGLHVGGALVAALTDSEEVPLQCAYLRVESRDGLADLEQFLIATTETNFTAEGQLDLNREHLELALESHPEDLKIFSIDSPVELEGQLTDLQVSVVSAGVIARGAASIAGALIAPPLAILPWLEGIGGEDEIPGCRQVMDEYERNSAQR